jgi:hypothetical protein
MTPRGQDSRGVGHIESAQAGPPPPSRTGAVSSMQRMVLHTRAGASPMSDSPVARGTAATQPKTHRIDVRV